jgi:hypothetical protein
VAWQWKPIRGVAHGEPGSLPLTSLAERGAHGGNRSAEVALDQLGFQVAPSHTQTRPNWRRAT